MDIGAWDGELNQCHNLRTGTSSRPLSTYNYNVIWIFCPNEIDLIDQYLCSYTLR